MKTSSEPLTPAEIQSLRCGAAFARARQLGYVKTWAEYDAKLKSALMLALREMMKR